MTIENVTIGADPELFLVNTKTQQVVSAIGIIPGEKGNAYLPKGFKKGFGLQIDNILAEFNIPPVKSKEDFITNMELMKNYIREYVKKYNPDYDIMHVASAIVPEDQLQDPIAQEFGCSVDYNVYTKSPNKKPNAKDKCLRSSGLHIHIGYNNPTINISLAIIEALDFFLGVPSILIDTDTNRRKLYGKAGCFRLTEYGLEYRVLSGFFLGDTALLGWIYDNTLKAINYTRNGGNVPNKSLVQKTIDSGDTETAKELIKNYNINIPSNLQKQLYTCVELQDL